MKSTRSTLPRSQLGTAVYAVVDLTSFSTVGKIIRWQKSTHIEKYSATLPMHRPSLPVCAKDVIIVTGSIGAWRSQNYTSGAIGGKFPGVQNLNHPGNTLKQRQIEALVDRGHGAAIVSSPEVILVGIDSKMGPLGVTSFALRGM